MSDQHNISTVPVRFNTDVTRAGYDIFIGQNIISQPEIFLAPLLKRPKIAIITDETIAQKYLPKFLLALSEANITFEVVTLPAGEASKSFAMLEMIVSKLLDFGIERSDSVLAFGGGVVGDITGFACSMLKRGCQFIQVPTTLLAQVDSSVGGKTAINTPQGKNLVGAFYQPRAVLTDIDTLKTLPLRQQKAGYAEIVKYGLLGDISFFEWLDETDPKTGKKRGEMVLDLDENTVIHAIKKSCLMKAKIVAQDEKELGKRALLNLGHTFGHALEAVFGYSGKLLHGEAVSIGMKLAFDYAATHDMISHEQSQRVTNHLNSLGCYTEIADIEYTEHPTGLSADKLMDIMMRDKKVEDGKLTLILPSAIGEARIVRDVPSTDIRSFWKKHL